jgi:iron-sulfur cluster insertion protein
MTFLLNITDSAVSRIAFLAKREGANNVVLRVSVESGGCSGLQYKYEFTNLMEEGDAVIKTGSVSVVVDKISQEFLQGSIVDYIETLGNAYFEIRNPKAAAKCGCGNSFTL